MVIPLAMRVIKRGTKQRKRSKEKEQFKRKQQKLDVMRQRRIKVAVKVALKVNTELSHDIDSLHFSTSPKLTFLPLYFRLVQQSIKG